MGTIVSVVTAIAVAAAGAYVYEEVKKRLKKDENDND